MSQRLHYLLRSCLILVPFLAVAGTPLVSAHTVAPDAGKGGIRSAGESALWGVSGTLMVPVRSAAQIDTTRIVPGTRDFLEPNAPNPFGIVNKTTKLAFTIGEMSRVQLRIYDFFYNEIVTIFDQEMAPGRHEVQFTPPPTMPSGMYFYELKTDRFRDLRRMIYIK